MDPFVHIDVSLTPTELADFLEAVAPARPVMIWGQPGIGKSAVVEQFFADRGMDCVSLLGSQIAPEDVMGVPQILNGKSRFCPPELIAQDDPYGLFLDEVNRCSHEVQSAFYSLIHEKRVGSYRMPEGSVVVAAGNRAADGAIVKPISSALLNRMLHVQLVVHHRDWLTWAYGKALSPLVIDYIEQRPDHLVSPPPKHEQPFSTPRSWHALSDGLQAFGSGIADKQLEVLAAGALSPDHAQSFRAFVKVTRQRFALDAILRGDVSWPHSATDRDSLYFLASSLRARLVKELPADRSALAGTAQDLSYKAKARIKDLASISLEAAQLAVAGAEDGSTLPAWFLVEVARDVPRLAAKRDTAG